MSCQYMGIHLELPTTTPEIRERLITEAGELVVSGPEVIDNDEMPPDDIVTLSPFYSLICWHQTRNKEQTVFKT